VNGEGVAAGFFVGLSPLQINPGGRLVQEAKVKMPPKIKRDFLIFLKIKGEN
jgi:hypothetical protein